MGILWINNNFIDAVHTKKVICFTRKHRERYKCNSFPTFCIDKYEIKISLKGKPESSICDLEGVNPIKKPSKNNKTGLCIENKWKNETSDITNQGDFLLHGPSGFFRK